MLPIIPLGLFPSFLVYVLLSARLVDAAAGHSARQLTLRLEIKGADETGVRRHGSLSCGLSATHRNLSAVGKPPTGNTSVFLPDGMLLASMETARTAQQG